MTANDRAVTISVKVSNGVKQRLAREAWERRETLSDFLRDGLTALVEDAPDEWRSPKVQAYCVACKASGDVFDWMIDFTSPYAGKVTPILHFRCPAGHSATQCLTATPEIHRTPGPLRSGDKLLLSLSQSLYAARVAADAALERRDEIVRRLRQANDFGLEVATIAALTGLAVPSVYRICNGLKPPRRPAAPAPRRRRRRRPKRSSE